MTSNISILIYLFLFYLFISLLIFTQTFAVCAMSFHVLTAHCQISLVEAIMLIIKIKINDSLQFTNLMKFLQLAYYLTLFEDTFLWLYK